MWFSGTATLERARQYNFKHLGPKKWAVWDRLPTAPYGSGPLKFDPFKFVYAAARSSNVGSKLGLRGQIAGLGLASAALAHMKIEKQAPQGLFLHQNFSLLKDFVGTSLKGTIGAAVAYMEMVDLGFVWQGHWEDCVSSGSSVAHPDFIFAKPSAICLVDAKGTTASADSLAKQEWRRQIYMNKATKLNFGGMASEGRVIATELSETSPAKLVTAYGKWGATAPHGSNKNNTPAAVASVQRANFIDAFFLVGLPYLAWKLVGNRNFGPLRHGAARLSLMGNEQVYMGPIRMTLVLDNRQWVMQPFCRTEIVEAAIKYVDQQEGVPMTDIVRDGGLVRSHLTNTDATIIDGPDGVGAIFRPVEFDAVS